MKQIQLTATIKEKLQAALGPDVEITDNYAVFESISLNTNPLPGKRGSLFQGAVVPASTLLAMVNHINSGHSLPLMIDHRMDGSPKGRIFQAGLHMAEDAVELRTLFYIDPTETSLIAKVNNGTYDEVSVQFLAEKILCSECAYDYRGADANWLNILEATCGEGHKVGEDGVHVRMIGLEEFVEISLVARGAADNPKIVGKSASKLAPATQERLAAQGFKNLDALICRASLGEDDVDTNALITQLSDAKAAKQVAEAQVTTLTATVAERDGTITALQADVAARDEQITTLTSERDEAVAASATADRDAAVAYLSRVLENVRVAAGREKGDLPETVAELTAAIDAETSQLTAILPVGGVAAAAGATEEGKEPKRSFAAFKN